MAGSLHTFARRAGRLGPYLVVALAVAGGMLWSRDAKRVADAADYRYYPPFRPYHNRLMTHHLGAEYLAIARAIRAGRGFSDPFQVPSGPTAWMPPPLPYLLAGLLWATGDRVDAVADIVTALQSFALVLTGWLAVAAVRRATGRGWFGWVAAALFVAELGVEFFYSFQITHDGWLHLLVLDALLVEAMRPAPATGRRGAVLWGVLGGGAALAGPVLGLVWAGLTVAVRRPGWRRGLLSVLAAGAVLLPWAVRNYFAFGRFIPVKSNLAYELYQQQFESGDGLMRQGGGFDAHPNNGGPARDRYQAVGEARFLGEKWDAFARAVRADPADFGTRVWNRAAAATAVPVPYDRWEDEVAPWTAWWLFPRVVHPLPLLAVGVLCLSARRWHRVEAAAAVAWGLWLAPYVVVSYYERYGFPLLGVKAVLVAAAAGRLWPAAGHGARRPAARNTSGSMS